MSWLRKTAAVAARDLRIEWRSRDLLATMVFFALVAVVLFRFAFDFVPTGPGEVRAAAFQEWGAGILWVTFVFAAILGLDRSFTLEKEGSGLEGLLLAPVDRSALLLGKALAGFVLTLAMEAVVVAAVALLYGADLLPVLGPLALVLAVNTFGFVLVGTVVSFLCGRTRRGSLLLPVLQVPLTLPLLLFAVRATGRLLGGGPAEAWTGPLKLSCGVVAVYLAVSLVVFDFVVED
jgi:heme exporter protein B